MMRRRGRLSKGGRARTGGDPRSSRRLPPAACLFPSPRGARATVLQHDALVQQFLAYVVGGLEILTLSRLLARGDALVDPCVRIAGLALHELLRIALQQADD